MAALASRRQVELIDLRRVAVADLDALLAEEVVRWREHLHWDFSSSADLIRRYIETASLSGLALLDPSQGIVGYAYYVLEDRKALIGDLYVAECAATSGNEYLLLKGILDELRRTPGVHRAECQLMMMRNCPDPALVPPDFPDAASMRGFSRNFMLAPVPEFDALRSWTTPRYDLLPWTDAWGEDSARLIAACYQDHMDSQINDQYRTAAGARRFLANIVQYPGCGSFFAPGSMVALGRTSGRLSGIVLASMVAPGAGHITQICVAPRAQGEGLGRELLRRSLATMREAGCREVSLTVTGSNAGAVRLYESFGFFVLRRFSANVWEW